jgi:hypothetical protein
MIQPAGISVLGVVLIAGLKQESSKHFRQDLADTAFSERERESFSSKKERDFPVRRTKKERVQTIFTLPPMIF